MKVDGSRSSLLPWNLKCQLPRDFHGSVWPCQLPWNSVPAHFQYTSTEVVCFSCKWSNATSMEVSRRQLPWQHTEVHGSSVSNHKATSMEARQSSTSMASMEVGNFSMPTTVEASGNASMLPRAYTSAERVHRSHFTAT